MSDVFGRVSVAMLASPLKAVADVTEEGDDVEIGSF
jgi:hypothetical protein